MKKQLRSNWWKYLAVLILPVILWTTVFSLRSRPDGNERLRILLVGEGADTAALQADLETALPSLTAQTLREITVTQETPGNGVPYGEWLISRQFSYDILLVSEPWREENMGQKYFSRLRDPLVARYSSVPQYTETADGNTLPYALMLSGADTRLGSYLEAKDGAWLLFFSPESVNLGAENGKGDRTDDAALAAAQYLSEEIH